MPRRWAVALALVLASGCMEFDPVGPGGENRDVILFLQLATGNLGPGSAADTLRVSGFVAQAARVPFTDDTLRIAARAVAPRHYDRGRWGYVDTLVLGPAALGQPVRVRLPTPEGRPLPLPEFDFQGLARRGPQSFTVRRGMDVILPLHRGAGPVDPVFETWTVTVLRGRHSAEIRATSPLPETVVLPASLLPADTATAVDIDLRSIRAFRSEGAGNVDVTMEAVLRWRVAIVP